MNALPQKTWRRPWRRTPPRAGLEALFLEHLPLIERVAEAAGRRAGFPPQEVEDFVSQVKLKLIDDDYAVLRKHRGDSKLTTFLITVINNQLKDVCNHKWGKYRPSAAARRLGPEARSLERLLAIDGHDPEAAIEILKTNHRVAASRRQLRQIAAELPAKSSRHFVGDEALAQRPSEAPEADAARRVADAECSGVAARVEKALNLALETLNAQDLLILKMFYRDGSTVAAIAGALHLPARPLYGRKEQCLAKLRAVFEARGLTWDEVRAILGWQGREVRADFGAADRTQGDDPTEDLSRNDQKRDDLSVQEMDGERDLEEEP